MLEVILSILLLLVELFVITKALLFVFDALLLMLEFPFTLPTVLFVLIGKVLLEIVEVLPLLSEALIIVVILVLYVGFKYYRSTEKGKKTIDKLLIKLPIIGKLISKTQIAQFTRILSLLLGSGLSIVKALELTGQSLSNSIFKDVVMESKEEVGKGGPLALPIARSEYFPLLVSSMISVGEETGEIDAVLEKVSQYYKEEVDTATSNLSTILEPLMLIIMGVAVGFIALGVYMPMFGLSQVMT